MTKLIRGGPQARLMAQVMMCPMSGCWLWTGSAYRNGYGSFCMNGRQITVHRASWILHNGGIEGGMWVCHKCDVKACVNPHHLFLGSATDNVRDMVRKGRHVCDHDTIRGFAHYRVTLSAERADELRSRYVAGVTRQVDLAAEFGVSQHLVSLIVRGERFRST